MISDIAMTLLVRWRQAQEEYRDAWWRWRKDMYPSLELGALALELFHSEAEVCQYLHLHEQEARLAVGSIVVWADEEGGLHEGPRGEAWRCPWISRN